MTRATLPVSSNQPDPRVLHILAALQSLCLILITLLSTVALATGVLPPLGRWLPVAWDQMEANTALCTLLSAFSLVLSSPRRSARSGLISRALALSVILIASVTAVEYLTHSSTWLDHLLVADPALHQGRSSGQATSVFLLLGVLMVFIRVRKSVFSYIIDAVTLALGTLMMVFVYGSIFGAMHLFEVSTRSHLSPQTLLGLGLLAMVAFSRRAEYGIFSVLLGAGISGNTARFAAPFAMILPFIRSTGRGLRHTEYATAVATLIAFCLILTICRRIDTLEKHIHDLSLRDELTGLYNRRGFYLLAEQIFRLAHRSGKTFSVLYLDLDNLKEINDALGHEAGSALLREMASILHTTFREIDVIGRLGGDEFVVAGQANHSEIALAAHRLEAVTSRANQDKSRPYTISFSFGHVTTDDLDSQTLQDLLQQADQIMYEDKRLKKAYRSAPHQEQPQQQISLDGAGANQLR